MQLADQTHKNPTDHLHDICALIAEDLSILDELIHAELNSSVPLTREVTQHVFKMRGKRLRPLLVILASLACSSQKKLEKKHYDIAVVLEFVHTATLLHDDVVDHSNLRRGQNSANTVFGNAASVLVGDFLYSRAFQILARHENNSVMRVLSETTNAIAEGEVLQLMNQHDADLTETNYFRVITQKTAQLFSAAANIGAILENADSQTKKAMAQYGLHLGIVFQIIDDLLDYETSSDITGKNIGDDLSEGKVTLPLIYAMQNTTPDNVVFIRNAIKNADLTALTTIKSILTESGAFFATREKAREHAEKACGALSTVTDSAYRQALADLVLFALDRKY